MGLFSSKKRIKPLPHDKPLDFRIPVGYEVGLFKPISRKDNAKNTSLSNERMSRTGHFTEYPAVKDFPYDKQRKEVGYAQIGTPKGKLGEKVVQKGCIRTVTDEHKVIRGVLYHPVPTNGKKTSGNFIPTQDVYISRTLGGLGS
ncbi:uncharacterized protein N7446_013255 [Penicillium canescens]|uniref:Uncharacterized protein n=1 Tax=Penicillium canescens TaxID=5083 RepID=A0AAD6N1Y0_PENCN|nr:uncharacterized protein N7446_013255 [Penicillium canescens]KAJ6022902.1 hypothetical protein N7460_013297 [Penicillium canescens]KAJ6025836.1 hypothetical protein N7444_013515 [Penicillium canescens]KAJ6042189.1 hypothetical protein N7446_013255 [Penicillium canescens]